MVIVAKATCQADLVGVSGTTVITSALKLALSGVEDYDNASESEKADFIGFLSLV